MLVEMKDMLVSIWEMIDGLSKAAHHVLSQAADASWTIFVSSSVAAEEDIVV